MSGLSPIKARELIKILKKIGFEERRQKGSHLFLSHPEQLLFPFIQVNQLALGFSAQSFMMLKYLQKILRN